MTTKTISAVALEGEPPGHLARRQSLAPSAQDLHPTYAGTFRCIGPACEDTCCGDWDIPVDRVTYLKYRQFPLGELGALVSQFVSVCDGNPHEKLYASIRRKPGGACPFFGEDRLCGIQSRYGPALLSSTCSTYPRSLAVVDGDLEGSLSLSCPEAARLVLLQPHSTQTAGDLYSGEFRTDNVFGVRAHGGVETLLLPVRALILDLLRDRSLPLWQRLLRIARLCIRLDSLHAGDIAAASNLVAGYREAFGQGNSPEPDQLSPGVAVRLEMAIALSNRRCQDRDCSRRFQNVFWEFIEGVGTAGSTGADEDVQRFRHASVNYLEPLLLESPFLMENYLVNYVYQHLFPFGRAGSEEFLTHTIAEEAVLLIVKYSWMTTLLTGVAALHGAAFNSSHIVTAVQAFTRATEHVPQVSEDALAWVRDRELDTFAGLAKLLRT